MSRLVRFFFNDPPTTEIYTLSLHDALPISRAVRATGRHTSLLGAAVWLGERRGRGVRERRAAGRCGHAAGDRKSTRLNSSHTVISYAVFCLKKKKQNS